ncbi:MAG: pirin family protein [Bacteroidetes bacterium]|nr:pirin family protein [Bacteroidota bacterium]
MISLIKSNTRGSMELDWLNARYSFSFAGYHNPKRMHFGVLRVLNDDIVAAGGGFGMHPHDNMEIITIPLEGALSHTDSLGNTGLIRKGEIQVMSAGTGILHSEFNHSKTDPVKLLQIWLYPNVRNVSPRYSQRTYDIGKLNKWQCLVSPLDKGAGDTWINQEAWFSIAFLEKDKEITYSLNQAKNGIFIFLIEGACTVEKQILARRDALSIEKEEKIDILATEKSMVLLIEVPMQV